MVIKRTVVQMEEVIKIEGIKVTEIKAIYVIFLSIDTLCSVYFKNGTNSYQQLILIGKYLLQHKPILQMTFCT